MSSSKVISQFSVREEPVPVGSVEFVDQFNREREYASPEMFRLRKLEEKHQEEIARAAQEAYRRGEMAGLERGLSESRRVQAQFQSLISQLTEYRRALYEDSQKQLLEIVFALADKITSARAELEQNTVLETIQSCLKEILDKTRIRIKVNPSQIDLVKGNIDSLRQTNESISSVTVESDARVNIGGCIVETDSGSADGRLESQLEMLKQKLIALRR